MCNFIDEMVAICSVISGCRKHDVVWLSSTLDKILGSRIKKIHFKDFRRGTAQLTGFVDLLSGDVEWDKVMDALIDIGYEGWVFAEMCPPYKLYPEQNIFNTSKTMDKILRRGC